MNKGVRFIIWFFVVIIAGILILGLIEPTDPVITRSIAIKAPKGPIYEQVANFRNWPNWNPWKQKDPSIRMVFGGDDAMPGSSFHWFGDEKLTGEGEMKMTSVKPDEIVFDVSIKKPRANLNSVIRIVDSSDELTKVTWSTSHHKSYPLNALYFVLNMNRRMGPDVESGLAKLKAYIEDNMKDYVEVKEVDYPGHTYAGVRNMVFFDDMNKFFDDSYGLLGKGAGGKINGCRTGLCYKWDTVNKRADMMAAYPVLDTTTPIKGASYLTIGASKAFTAVQKGGNSTAMKIHRALGNYVDKKNMTTSLIVEEYTIGPPQEPDSNKWVTNIYYLVK